MTLVKLQRLPLLMVLALSFVAFGCGKKAETEAAPSTPDTAVEEGAAAADDHAGHDHAEGEDHAGHDHAAADDHAGHDHGAEGEHAGHGHGAGDHGDDDIMAHVIKEGDYDPADVVRQPGAKVGDITRCTVSGEAFRVTEEHPSVTYNDEEVYFCCPGCIRRFQRNPDQYIADQK